MSESDAMLPLTLHFRGESALALPLEVLKNFLQCHALPLFGLPIDFPLSSFAESIRTKALFIFTVLRVCLFVCTMMHVYTAFITCAMCTIGFHTLHKNKG